MTDKTAPITRYCFRSEGMSDPPEQFESPTGDVVDYWDHLQIEKELLARIESLEAQLSARQAAPDGPWKCGDEFLPYHPDASHVDPAYRDGWNDCYRAAPPQPRREPKCGCETCRPITPSDMRMVLCPDCGNKRCPKANHHDNACTNSNAPGQPGSSWEHVKPHGATND